jgi:hypothetical protein
VSKQEEEEKEKAKGKVRTLIFDEYYHNVPVDNRLSRPISIRFHKCDICKDHIPDASANIESYIDTLNEISDSYESEYDKNEPRLLLCKWCQKSYLIPCFT